MALPGWDTGADDTWPEVKEMSPWDTLVLGGHKMPGVARIHARRGRKHDRAAPPGVDGESFHDLGASAADLDIAITVWSREQLEELSDVLDSIMPTPKKIAAAAQSEKLSADVAFFLGSDQSPQKNILQALKTSEASAASAAKRKAEAAHAVTISHPSLRRLRVRSIIITEEENFQPGHQHGTFEWRCRAVEYMGKGKGSAVSTVKGSKDSLNLSGVSVAPPLVPPSKNPSDLKP